MLIGTLQQFDANKTDLKSYMERFEPLVFVNGVKAETKLPLCIILMENTMYFRIAVHLSLQYRKYLQK